MRAAWVAGAVALLCFATATVAATAIEPVARPAFDRRLVDHGAALAAVGNCASCHSGLDQPPYAGGVPLKTPFGTVYGSNLTPDPDTGLGRWPEAAFVRAMREGVSRDGHLLYPAFPYTHFTDATDADLGALYAYLMTRDAVHAVPPPNRLIFPLGFRPLLAGWNLLFLEKGDAGAARAASAADRGAYLVDSLAHCGACHTPRGLLGNEQRDRRLGGAVIDGWYVPPLDARTPSPQPWTVEAMTAYLRTGLVADHAIAGGPMQQAVAGLAGADPADIDAIARYIVGQMGPVTPARAARAEASRQRARRPLAAPLASDPRMTLGATVYATTCGGCHDRGRAVGSDGALQMPLAVALYDDDPHSFVRIVRDGVHPSAGQRGRVMPAYGATLTDAQLTALAAYLRQAAADAPPWPRLEKVVEETR